MIGGDTGIDVREGSGGGIGPATDAVDLAKRKINSPTGGCTAMPQAVRGPREARGRGPVNKLQSALEVEVNGTIGWNAFMGKLPKMLGDRQVTQLVSHKAPQFVEL